MKIGPIPISDAFESALLEFADATASEQDRAKVSAEHAAIAFEHFDLLEVETPFEISFGETSVEGVIDLIARDPNGRLVVIDYKTGRTEAGHYSLQMSLYHRVASLRYAGQGDSAILRLSPDGAVFSLVQPLPAGDLERAIAEVGSFEAMSRSPGRGALLLLSAITLHAES